MKDPGREPWDRSSGFEGTDIECVPVISPPGLGTIAGYHLLSATVKFPINLVVGQFGEISWLD